MASQRRENALQLTTRDGKRQGPWAEWYENGQVRAKGEYKDDVLNGPVWYYFDDGKFWALNTFTKGIKDGRWTELDHDGKTVKDQTFKLGILESDQSPYPPGTPPAKSAAQRVQASSEIRLSPASPVKSTAWPLPAKTGASSNADLFIGPQSLARRMPTGELAVGLMPSPAVCAYSARSLQRTATMSQIARLDGPSIIRLSPL